MIKRLLRKYQTWRYANSQKYKVKQDGTLLNAFYNTKTIFIHIPKTAGVSLLNAIYDDVILLESHRSMYFNKIALNIKSDKYFSFTVVRNPFARLYSAYIFLEKGGINRLDKNAFDTHLAKFKDFEDFVLNGLNKRIIFQITHLIPQHEYLCDLKGNIEVDFVGRFENLEKDIKSLSSKLGKEIVLSHLNKNTNKLNYTDVYTCEMIRKVNKVYKQDFEIFKYTF